MDTECPTLPGYFWLVKLPGYPVKPRVQSRGGTMRLLIATCPEEDGDTQIIPYRVTGRENRLTSTQIDAMTSLLGGGQVQRPFKTVRY